MRRFAIFVVLVGIALPVSDYFISGRGENICAIQRGEIDAFVIVGDTLYTSEGTRQVKYDISDPTAPIELGSFHVEMNIKYILNGQMLGLGHDAFVSVPLVDFPEPDTAFFDDDISFIENIGDYCYVWQNRSDSISIYDLTTEELPEFRGSYHETDARFLGSSLLGDYLYIGKHIATGGYHCAIYDVTSPETPVLLDSLENLNFAYAHYIGDYAIVHEEVYAYDSMSVYDMTDPTSPVYVGDWEVGYGPICDKYQFRGDYEASITRVYELSDPLSPELIDSIDFYFMDLTVGSCADFGDYKVFLFQSPYIENFIGFVDVSDGFEIVTTMEAAPFRSYRTRVKDDILYATARENGLWILDISNRQLPKELAIFDEHGSAHTIEIQGDLAYVGRDYTGLMILDITEPESPELVYEIDDSFSVFDIAFAGDYMYLATDIGLLSYDITDPESPVYALTVYEHPVATVKVHENDIFTNTYSYTHYNIPNIRSNLIYGIEEPTAPDSLGRFCSWGSLVHFEDDYAYSIDELTIFVHNHDSVPGDNFLLLYVSWEYTFPSFIEGNGRFLGFHAGGGFRHDEFLGFYEVDPFGLDIQAKLRIEREEDPASVFFFDSSFSCSFKDGMMFVGDLVYDPDFNNETFSLLEGWNLIASPFEEPITADMMPVSVIPPFYAYDNAAGSYEEVDTISVGRGYWVLADTACEFTLVDPTPRDTLTWEIYPGWNLMGLNHDLLPTGALCTEEAFSEFVAKFIYDTSEKEYINFYPTTFWIKNGIWVLSMDSLTVHLD